MGCGGMDGGSDHGTQDTKVVILGNTVPSLELTALLSSPEFSLRCKWLEGSVLVDADLVRCDATKAVCTFIFCDKTASSAADVYAEVCVSICVCLSLHSLWSVTAGYTGSREHRVGRQWAQVSSQPHNLTTKRIAKPHNQASCSAPCPLVALFVLPWHLTYQCTRARGS